MRTTVSSGSTPAQTGECVIRFVINRAAGADFSAYFLQFQRKHGGALQFLFGGLADIVPATFHHVFGEDA